MNILSTNLREQGEAALSTILSTDQDNMMGSSLVDIGRNSNASSSLISQIKD